VILSLLLLLVAGSAVLAVVAVADLLPAGSRTVSRQLGAVERLSRGEAPAGQSGVRPPRLRAEELLGRIGRSLPRLERRATPTREILVQAGYRHAEAATVFSGGRTAATIALPLAAVTALLLAGSGAGPAVFAACWAAGLGWLAPTVYLRARVRARRKEIDRALPDALDLVVVCMEAGLGLNQALARVADEVRHFSRATSDEFALVNLEMRAGVPRVEAFRGLGARMGVAELRSLSTILIQADRFGTSVGQALRVHAETARTRRRQRAEEAAAKTTIKLIFPLVLCIFPTIFVVVLGPAIIGIIRTLSGL
jgi:tight adherence protein C